MDYKDTLNLPKTDFPMKANLPKKEVEILAGWDKIDLYQRIREARAGAETFILHDGPPYANGNIHSGTALNKILKDIVVKIKTMSDLDTPYVPGWDCHGLPIEHQVDKKLGKKKRDLSVSEIRKQCREYAEKFIDIQREEFMRLGVTGDWNNPYLTLAHDYEVGIAKELAKFVANGSLYRGNKPVHWCPSCATALAEAEVEHDDHTSPSIYAKFRLTEESAKKLGLPEENSFVVIWTTTPWTLPANLAITLHPDFDYNAVKAGDDILILANELTESSMKAFEVSDYEVIKTFKGKETEGLKAIHPFLDQDSLLIVGEHVTTEQGTGCVHTAPGHGQDDYVIGQKYGLEIFNPVDQYGKFVEGTPFFAGLKVWKANPEVIALLKEKGALLASENINHSYPHCWRCRGPIIFRATPQWFISMDKNNLRKKAMEAVRKVDWIPAWGEERIYKMMENRPDWCISRQRVWGVPITAFYCAKCDEALFDEESANHVVSIMEKDGVDAWFDKDVTELLPHGATCSACEGKEFIKGTDILDVWFDSGASHSIVLDADKRLHWPADLYLEGSDQHRGWFHTSLLESVGTRGEAPYKEVLTHGYVVDGKGKKMSKSLGNTIAPQTIIDKYGAEIIRLWVASEDYRDDIRLSDVILKRSSEAYRKIRNTLRFMMGNLDDFDPAKDMVAKEDRLELDQVIGVKFCKLTQRVIEAYNRYEFHIFYHAIHNFCVIDLSSFYLDIVKDRVYTYPAGSLARRSAQSAMYEITEGLVRLMAPVLCFTAEEAWGRLPGDDREESVHLARFPKMDISTAEEALAEEWERVIAIRDEVLSALEVARQNKLIGHSLDAKITLSLLQNEQRILEKRKDDLPFLFIVSQVKVAANPGEGDFYRSEEVPGLTVKVERADGDKCARCWNYSETVGASTDHPEACSRCIENLGV